MPAGVGWGQYFRFSVAAYLSMMAGAQVVHMFYKPLEDLETLIEKHKERILLEHKELSARNSNTNVPTKT